jgi:D-alanine-D-alanine ligase-like ATP-grasp enzyme
MLTNIEGQSPKLYVLEINTIPGLTTTSLFPQQAKAAGISFSKMLDYIIKSDFRNSARERKN